jgi:hypothetical protein
MAPFRFENNTEFKVSATTKHVFAFTGILSRLNFLLLAPELLVKTQKPDILTMRWFRALFLILMVLFLRVGRCLFIALPIRFVNTDFISLIFDTRLVLNGNNKCVVYCFLIFKQRSSILFFSGLF